MNAIVEVKFIKKIVIFFISLTFINTTAFSASLNNTFYEVCFTPGQNCTQLIIDRINQAKKSIFVQAYSFTSAPIAKAIVFAARKGVKVKIILDKSQVKRNRYSSATFFLHQGIATWIDYKPAIAHNKVIIIDESTVITGSFNFTKAAQFRNAENVIIIENADLAKKYLMNWEARKAQSNLSDLYKNRL